jgi:fission process protein 1
LNESHARYAGYTAAFARRLRYLAFASDFGEALRPVVAARIVNGSYAVAIGYCLADVAWEGYKHQRRGNITEKGHSATLTQILVERATFQAVASMALPTVIIHSSVDFAKHYCKRIGRFQKWGPSIVGLSIIPLLPMYLDEPVEHALGKIYFDCIICHNPFRLLEWAFENYGPWASPKPHKD